MEEAVPKIWKSEELAVMLPLRVVMVDEVEKKELLVRLPFWKRALPLKVEMVAEGVRKEVEEASPSMARLPLMVEMVVEVERRLLLIEPSLKVTTP